MQLVTQRWAFLSPHLKPGLRATQALFGGEVNVYVGMTDYIVTKDVCWMGFICRDAVICFQ